MSETDIRHAIAGAFMFGYQGNNKPQSDDHWLAEWWTRGRAACNLESAFNEMLEQLHQIECDLSLGPQQSVNLALRRTQALLAKYIPDDEERTARSAAALSPASLLKGNWAALRNVDQLISSPTVGTDKVNAEGVDTRLDGSEGNINVTADALPHGSLPADGDLQASTTLIIQGDA